MKTWHIYSAEEAANNVDLYTFMEENGFWDVYDLFQSDPDILRTKNSEVSFTEVDIDKNTVFVIYNDSEYQATESEIKGILQRFYTDNFRDYFTQLDSSWTVFRSLVNGIAYRGGQGYHYAKWGTRTDNENGRLWPPASFSMSLSGEKEAKSRTHIFENLVSRFKFKRKAPDHNREPFQK